jgi:hypothetical protein
VVFPSVRFLSGWGTLATGQGLAAVRVEFVESQDDLLKGNEKEASHDEAGGLDIKQTLRLARGAVLPGDRALFDGWEPFSLTPPQGRPWALAGPPSVRPCAVLFCALREDDGGVQATSVKV